MLLDIVTKRLLLNAALSWVLALLASSLPLLVWLCVATLILLVVGHVGAGSKILLLLLAIRIVILAFLFSPFTRI